MMYSKSLGTFAVLLLLGGCTDKPAHTLMDAGRNSPIDAGPADQATASPEQDGGSAAILDADLERDGGVVANADSGLGEDGGTGAPLDGGGPVVATCGKSLAGEPVGVNGVVTAISVASDGTAYLGGTFTQAGPVTGGGVPFDVTSGEPTSGFPKVAGDVYAIVADGTGGWYLGGDFTHVGTAVRKNLAHIGSDGVVDPDWSVDADGIVRALALGTDSLYVGGDFSTLGGLSRGYFGAVALDGTVTSWNPGTELDDPEGPRPSPVRALLVSGGMLYVGGDFTKIAGQPRTNLASFNLDGSLSTWDPEVSMLTDTLINLGTTLVQIEVGSVRTLLIRGTTLFVGGSFETVSGIPHRALVNFDAVGKVLSWDPQFDLYSRVEAMATGPGVLYVGGYFNGTYQKLRSQLAAFDDAGNLTNWNPTLSPAREFLTEDEQHIYALSVVGDTIYVGGDFGQGGAQPRANLAAVDRSGKTLGWNPFADGPVYALAQNGNTLYAGGKIRTLCGQTRHHLAAIDKLGKLTDWNPDADGYVYALAAGSNVVYVGGQFSTVGGQSRSKLAAVATDGTLTSWNPSVYAYGWVQTLALKGNTLYVGGNFNSIGGQARNQLAAVDSSGAVLPWAPQTHWGPSSMVTMGDVLYVGGTSGLGAIAADGSILAWNPSPNSLVYALATDGTTLYVGGYFTSIAGETRNHLAAFDSSGKLLPWDPDAVSAGTDLTGVTGLAVLADTVYVAGFFTSIAGQTRNGLGAIRADGVLAPWDPDPDIAPRTVAAGSGAVFVGDYFTFIGSTTAAGIARVSP